MHRCYAEKELWQEDRVTLSRDESAHLVQVLRASVGDELEVFDGEGRIARARLVTAKSRAAELEIMSTETVERAKPEIALIQAIPKSKKTDLIVEKATELGAAAVFPVITERTVVSLKADQKIARRERWEKIAVSAAKQCGTPWIPHIADVLSLPEALEQAGPLDLLLAGTLEPDTEPVRDVLRNLPSQPARIGCVIGPEGDLSPGEVSLCREQGARLISLGDLVLRAETAAICLLSIVGYELR